MLYNLKAHDSIKLDTCVHSNMLNSTPEDEQASDAEGTGSLQVLPELAADELLSHLATDGSANVHACCLCTSAEWCSNFGNRSL